MRKFAVFIAASFLSLFLFLTVTSTSVVITVTPAHVKSWLKGSDFYDTFVDNLLKQSQTLNKNGSDSGSAPLNDPGVQVAAKKALTPAVLQSTTEQIIDGLTPWLQGKTPKPSFSVDLTQVKSSLADNIGDYARTRYANLPVCVAGQVPDTSDILAIACRVPGYNANPDIQKAVNDLKTSQDFLANPVITADTLSNSKDSSQKPLFERLSNVPRAYKWVRISPYILGFITLLCALVLVCFSSPRRKGIRSLAGILYVSAAILLFEVWATSFGLSKAQDQLTKGSDLNSGMQTTMIRILKEIQHSLNQSLLMFVTGFLAIAVGLTIYLFLTRGKTQKKSSEAGEGTEKSETTEPLDPQKPKDKPPTQIQG